MAPHQYPARPHRVIHRHRARGVFALALFAGALALSACSSGGGANNASSGGVTGTHITISNFSFSPSTLEVSPGQMVSVTNHDNVTHTVTSSASPPAFDTGNIAENQTVSFRAPTKPGSYAYICAIHPFMNGTLQVR